jgi:hypothetical protein
MNGKMSAISPVILRTASAAAKAMADGQDDGKEVL